jgi:hypothetical protein
MLSVQDMLPSYGITYFSAVLLYGTMINSILLGVLKKHSAQQGSVVTEWSWNTHNKYCAMALTLSTCNSLADSAAQKYVLHYPHQHHADTNVLTGAASPWNRKCNTYGTHEFVHGLYKTPAYEDTIIGAVEQELWRSSCNITWELGLYQPKVFKVMYFMKINCNHTTTRKAHVSR